MSAPKERIPVVVLGATGTVGQRFIQLLESHPYFVVAGVGASPRSAGKPYTVATNWKMPTEIPASTASLNVQTCEPKNFPTCRIMFSGLDSDVAGEIETDFANAGFAVFSNAKNHRMDPLVPLVVPLVNTSHLSILDTQRKAKGYPKKGFLVTNANCATTGLVVPLAALQNAFGPITKMHVTTLQAISGAGYPGVPSLDIFDNVVPYISGEEEKLEIEPGKILGHIGSSGFVSQEIQVSAVCNRVAVLDGHTECVSLSFERRPPPSVEEIEKVLNEYIAEPTLLGVPSAPKNAIIVRKEVNRPQPRLDRDANGGNSVTVGRIRKCNLFDIKFVLLSHNTILGAAGSSIMNAEVA
ncbi:hypothetical protein HK096_008600, partial [Nowakowskiella sp. JEL0078]